MAKDYKEDLKKETMKATDLMIGDWVMTDKASPFVVTDIETAWWPINETPFTVAGKDFLAIYGEDLRPVRLTKKILEKNGFDNETGWGNAYVFEDDHENQVLVYYEEMEHEGAAFYADVSSGCLEVSLMPICYVHELQHILRICRINKEIIL